jgi:hypothetical protein
MGKKRKRKKRGEERIKVDEPLLVAQPGSVTIRRGI